MSDDVVYHFTDSLHLPWIVESGELRPYLNCLRGIGDINYLWATTKPEGDKTARALIDLTIESNWLEKIDIGDADREDLYAIGKVVPVRFTLPPAGFVPWSAIKRRSSWTMQQVEELEADDRKTYGEYGQAKWRLRRKALPIASALKVEAWIDRWIAIKPTRKHLIQLPESEDSPIMGITINGFSYYSETSVETMTIKGRRYDFNKYTVPSRPDLEEFLEELQEEEYSDE